MMTYQNILNKAVKQLEEAGITEAALDARLLLMYVFDCDYQFLLLHGNEEAEESLVKKYFALVAERTKRIPLQHLTHCQNFMGFDFYVDEHVLIPRQDTECLVEEAMLVTEDGMRVLDMCTGSGCILISLACYKNEIEGVGIDLSAEALAVARKNAGTLFAGHSGQLTFIKGDLFDALSESELFDVIVSNPPYIRSDVIETLETEVKEHDPHMALDGGVSGLDFYEQITAKAPDYLRAGGYLLYEIGFDQGEDVKKLMESHGFVNVTIIKDLAGNDRVVKGRKRCLTN